MVRIEAVVLAAALAIAPLGAQAADLVVWWEEGLYPEEGARGWPANPRLLIHDSRF